MNKLAAIFLAFLIGISLQGCSVPEIKGTPSYVIQKCQYVNTDQDVTVTVTGHVSGFISQSDSGSWYCTLAESGIDDESGQVCCIFKDKPIAEPYKILSVTGKLKLVLTNYVLLEDCKTV